MTHPATPNHAPYRLRPIPHSLQRHNAQTAADRTAAATLLSITSHALASLDTSQARDLSLAHHANLGALLDGTATPSHLWQWGGGVLTWAYVAAAIGAGQEEMQIQSNLLLTVCERYRRTGHVELRPDEQLLARDGCGQMDDLAELVPRAVAIAAAQWSENEINEIRRSHTWE